MSLSEIIYWADELRDPPGFSNILPVYVKKQTKKNALKLHLVFLKTWSKGHLHQNHTEEQFKNGFLKNTPEPQNYNFWEGRDLDSAFAQGALNNFMPPM